MAIAIIRVTVVSSKNKPSDLSWLYFWSNIELVVALIVSSLASFRSLYVSSQPKPTSSRSTNIFKRSLPRTRGILLDDKTYTPVLGTKRSDVEIQNLRTASNNSSG
ncbi:predicted protein [Sclerotinia sclerotiorum 1980 UF-70]|uniref:Uncharacterized protein n=1 Tax=Sclerotinia sclerotiorum (strain ATCC 18683 / 1980 / Ss-1) TaxID=665079 RepID=A7F475_SCLS1|nr:predicted protein [Sclerotinia sclerotiorum 1980 UF-70]EDN97546.1 predicted protein [Sclerotinia sclerotiorum 1980 UF-70]